MLKNICYVNIILMFSIPLVYITSDFLRIQRPFLLLNYCTFIGLYKKMKFPKIEFGGIYIKYKTLFVTNIIVYIVLFIMLFNYQSLFAFLKF